MKKQKTIKFTLLSTILLILISCGTSRVIVETPETEIKNIDNNSNKNSNFIKANEWMVQAFNNAKSVIQFKDKEAGIVKGKYVMKDGYTAISAYDFSRPAFFSIITLRVKDKAVRIEVQAPSGMYSQKDIYGGNLGFTKEMFLAESNKLISSFEAFMKKESINDNW
jgi:hypothetical protein